MRSIKRLLGGLAIASAAALAPAPAAGAAECPGADVLASAQSTVQIEQSVLCLIDERRQDAGLAAVVPNSKLREAGARHSNDMVDEGFFAHTSPAGDSFIDRISVTGYMRGARSWLVGENLVWGSGTLGTPAGMVEAWMDSPPHRANLLRSRFREVGIAAVKGTPADAGDRNGVTVSSEYGYREARKGSKAHRARKARARARARLRARS